MNKSGLAKVASLYRATDKHGREYLHSRYNGKSVYYVFTNSYPDTDNADFILFRKRLDVRRRPGKRNPNRRRGKWK